VHPHLRSDNGEISAQKRIGLAFLGDVTGMVGCFFSASLITVFARCSSAVLCGSMDNANCRFNTVRS